ncbi:MAG TPA: prolyl oligopeptidase family serine peptidase, partial [Longimicrobiaceae bacterium]
MKITARTSIPLLLSAAWLAPAAAGAQRLAYPTARTVEQVDDYHGTRVADPYRWLEDTDSPDTRAWITAQNALTEQYLGAIPERARIRQRLTELWNFPRWSSPSRRGNRYFYFKNTGLQNQSVLYVASSPHAEPRVLLDPNTLRADGTEALSTTATSDDGRLLGYGVASGGSDWQEFRVRDVATGRDLLDRVRWVKFSGLAWTKDGGGFFYARYEQPAGNALTAAVHDQKVYYHRAGTPQEQDVLVFQRSDQPDFLYFPQVTEDGRYLVLSVSQGSDRRNRIYVMDLGDAARPRVQGTVVRMLDAFDAGYTLLGNDGPVFFFTTDNAAPRGRVIAVDLRDPSPGRWRTLVPEGPDAIVSSRRVNGKFVLSMLHDVAARLRVYNVDGSPAGEVPLPGLGAVGGLSGRNQDRELFFTFASFLSPSTVYRYDFATRRAEPVWPVRMGFDASRYVTEQVFYTSKDGTRIPMFITHRRGMALDGNNPTLLYGYGGFNSAVLPSYSTAVAVWLEMGGVYASANLRGGNEYGEAWHQGGMLANKQNVFDDFIAAGEYLVAQKYTSPAKLAISGASNGGLLVGAVLNQRPDLFGAALPAVGVMDMLRFQKFTAGRFWVDDYGSSDNKEDFEAQYKFSPYHVLLRNGPKAYPATMVTTADTDDRVVPGHSFKFAAALQSVQKGPAPVLIRIETKAGHGAGKPTAKIIEEVADQWAFLVRTLDFQPA